MRQWMVDPKIMCRKHLLGEHVEHHMLLGTLKKKKNVQGYVDKNLFEPQRLFSRHAELVKEMYRRKFNHQSELTEDSSVLDYLPRNQYNNVINKEESLKELLRRCPECRKRYESQHCKS